MTYDLINCTSEQLEAWSCQMVKVCANDYTDSALDACSFGWDYFLDIIIYAVGMTIIVFLILEIYRLRKQNENLRKSV